MAKPNDALAREIEEIRGELQRLRDEIRVRLHLGAMDARDAFVSVEHDIDHIGRDVTHATRGALDNARKELKKLAAAFKSQGQDKHA